VSGAEHSIDPPCFIVVVFVAAAAAASTVLGTPNVGQNQTIRHPLAAFYAFTRPKNKKLARTKRPQKIAAVGGITIT